jgi:hypothetical protein
LTHFQKTQVLGIKKALLVLEHLQDSINTRGSPHAKSYSHHSITSQIFPEAPRRMGKMEKVSVTDLYEACYLLLNGAELETVRCIPAGKNINCELVLCGGSLTDLMDEYYQKNAMVNLFSFRSVYSRVSSHIHNAKRSFKKGELV